MSIFYLKISYCKISWSKKKLFHSFIYLASKNICRKFERNWMKSASCGTFWILWKLEFDTFQAEDWLGHAGMAHGRLKSHVRAFKCPQCKKMKVDYETRRTEEFFGHNENFDFFENFGQISVVHSLKFHNFFIEIFFFLVCDLVSQIIKMFYLFQYQIINGNFTMDWFWIYLLEIFVDR